MSAPTDKMRAAALNYAARDWAVFPLNGKIPFKGTRGFKDATTDRVEVERMWHMHPGANIGIATGSRSRLVVLDIDVKNGRDGEASLRALNVDLPPTLEQSTPSGGRHLIYTLPEGVSIPSSVDAFGPGLDIRADGGYIVAAPSLVSGKAYRPTKRGRSPAPAPAWLLGTARREAGDTGLAVLQPYSPLDTPIATVREWLEILSAEEYGDWIAFGQALKLAFGDQAFDLWHEWSAKSEKFPGTAKAREKWATFDRNRDRALKTLRSIRQLAEKRGWRAKPAELVIANASDLSGKELPEVCILLDELVTSGLMLLSGQPKVGKSWLVLALILALGAGKPFWNRRTLRKCRVLYLALEDNERRLKSRLSKLLGDDAIGANFRYTLNAPRVDAGLADLLRKQVREGRLDLVVIDTLAMIRPLDAKGRSAWQADYESVQALKALADEMNVAIIVVTHNSKSGSQGFAAQNAISATGGLMAGVDGWWVIEHTGKAMDEKNLVRLTVEHRDLPGGEYAITFNRDTAQWDMLGAWPEVQRGAAQGAIIDTLHGSRDGLTGRQLADALGKTPQAVGMALLRMRHAGLVVQTDDGKYKAAKNERR